MALYEAEHPLAQEITTIMLAAEKGLGRSDFIPPGTTYNYVDPLENLHGAAVLLLTNFKAEDLIAIHVPVFTSLDGGLTVLTDEGLSLTDARIKIADMQGRDFPINSDGDILSSPYIQFDLDSDGVIFSARPEEGPLSLYGRYESEEYDRWSTHARKHAGLVQLYGASIQFLDQAA